MFQTKRSVRSVGDTEGSALLLSDDASYFDSVGPSKGIFHVAGVNDSGSLPTRNEPQVKVSRSFRSVKMLKSHFSLLWISGGAWLSFCTLNLPVVNVHVDGKCHSYSFLAVLKIKQSSEAIFPDIRVNWIKKKKPFTVIYSLVKMSRKNPDYSCVFLFSAHLFVCGVRWDQTWHHHLPGNPRLSSHCASVH